MSNRPYVIGLTGNIATGKSLIAQMLSEWGAEHVDADRLAHRAMARGTATWMRIVDAFGEGILGPDGEIDRARLGTIVFSAPDALARLEEIVHPDVVARTRLHIAHSSARVVVVEAIKLVESGMVVALCDALWVVTAPREVQIARLIVGRGMSHDDAVLRVDAQPSQSQKVARADVVIDNSGSIEAMREQVMRAWAEIDLASRSARKMRRGDGR